MKKITFILNLALLIVLLIVIPLNVSGAMIDYLGWQSSSGTFPSTPIVITNVEQWDNAVFLVEVFEYSNDPYTVNILLKQGNNVLQTIAYVQGVTGLFSEEYNVDTNNLNGNYQVELQAVGLYNLDTETISLTVNQVTPNTPPQVTDISWDSTSGIINFQATANDPDGEVQKVDFQIFYDEMWHALYTDTNGNDGWTYQFDSTDIHYDNNVKIRAIAYDGEDWSDELIEGPFTILNNNAPSQLTSPSPANNAQDISIIINQLSWQGGEDSDGDDVTYNVYFNGDLICGDITIKSCSLTETLEYNTIYLWYVSAIDEFGEQTTGPTWTFTTESQTINHAPTISLLSPINGAQDVNVPVTLTWDGYDEDGDILYYTVYLNDEAVNFCNGITTESCALTSLNYNTLYNWYVEVTDNIATVDSNTWSFTTIEEPDTTPPYTYGHNPDKNAQNVPIDTDIVVHIADDGVGVDMNTIEMKVEGQPVSFSIYVNANGYELLHIPSISFNYDQTVNVEVSASDLSSNSMIDTWTFTTESQTINQQPTAIIDSPIGTQNINIGTTIDFTGHGEDSDGSITAYSWDFNNDGVEDSNLASPSYTFNQVNTYTVNFKVKDNLNSWSEPDTLTIIVNSVNHAPEVIVDYPNGGETLTGTATILYTANDIDGDELIISIDISSNNGVIWGNLANGLGNTGSYSFDTASYTNGEQYLIKVIADDSKVSSSDISNNVFTIYNELNLNQPPYQPSNPIPSNGAVDVSINPTLQWTGGDPDGDTVTYDIYLDNYLFASNIEQEQYSLSNLDYNTEYSWYVVAKDEEYTVTGPTWLFTTEEYIQLNTLPTISLINPVNGAQDVNVPVTLTWDGYDEDGDTLYYTVYLDDEIITSCNGITSESCIVSNLIYQTIYTWYVEVTDNIDIVESEIWSFTTEQEPWENTAPSLTIIQPTLGEAISNYYDITWEATDLDQAQNSLDIKIEYKRIDLIPLIVITIPNPFSTWQTLENLQDNNDGIYTWNTNLVENGEYKLRITVTDDEGTTDSEEVSHFMIDNIIITNHAPQVTNIVGYTNSDSGVIDFVVNTYDQDGDDITQIDFKLYYGGSWHSISCNENIPNVWMCNFDSTNVIEYDNNVQAKAKAYDGEDWGNTFYTNTFTIDNTQLEPEPEPTVKIDKHKFSIVNVIPKVKSNNIELYVNIKNKGNKDEDVTLKATIIQTGFMVYDNVNLDVQEGSWRTIQLPKLNPGVYVVNVQAYNNKYKDNRLVVVEI
ncbi:MAG: PKD domain-containing protein [Nanoarchaeota archaeon]|nr:PKD domain-containing protein [Nanoarchaeota archaeon]